MAFKTPDPWQRSVGVRPRYDDVHFERNSASRVKGTILGVGSRLFDSALEQACQTPDTYTAVTDKGRRACYWSFVVTIE